MIYKFWKKYVNKPTQEIPVQKTNLSLDGILPVYSALDGDKDISNVTEAVARLVDGDGWKLIDKNSVIEAVSKEPAPNKDGKDNVVPCYARFVAEKIPAELFRLVEGFFQDVFAKYRSEGCVFFYYNKDTRHWIADAPEQKIPYSYNKTSTSLAVTTDSPPAPPPGYVHAGDAHSHPTIPAGFSGTDNRGDQFSDGIHICIGDLDEDAPSYAFSIVSRGVRHKMKRSDLIESAPFPPYPAEWLDRVKEESSVWQSLNQDFPKKHDSKGRHHGKSGFAPDPRLPEHYHQHPKKNDGRSTSGNEDGRQSIPENAPLKDESHLPIWAREEYWGH